MTRSFLRRVARALIGVVLLAQLAVSAYACPALASGAAMDMSTMSMPEAGSSAPDATVCAGMARPIDADFANLCAAHCQLGQQSDHAATLTVPAALLTALYTLTPQAAEPATAPRPAAAMTSALAAAFPPLAILHCCFRL